MLETARLVLRSLALDHAALLVRLFDGDWEAVKHTGRMPYPVSEAAFREWIALHVEADSQTFLITRRSDREALGAIGFGGDSEIAEIGYALGRSHWGRGYATEGVGALVEHARSAGLCALEGFAFVDNPASAAVLRKAGFADLGVAERDYPKRGGMRRVRHFMKLL